MTTLQHDDVFTVAEYPYTRFSFGTDRGYAARYGETRDDPGIPWANPLPAVLSDTPITRETPVAHLAFGALVTTPGYGTYRLERDHNRNVKFVPVAMTQDVEPRWMRDVRPAR